MNISFITTHLNIGGIAVYTTSLAKALVEKGHRVTVFSSGGDMVADSIKDNVIHKKIDIKTKSELSPKLWLNLSRLKKVIADEKPDIIHAQTRVAQVLAALVSEKINVPFVSTCHGFFKKRLSRKLFGCWGSGVIAISEAVKNHLMTDFGVPEDKITLIHNGIDVNKFHSSRLF